MAEIPVRFKRATARFDEHAKARLCESSGSEHLAEDSPELADLVNSFMERGEEGGGDGGVNEENREVEKTGSGSEGEGSSRTDDSDKREMERLLAVLSGGDDAVARRIRAVTETACRSIGTESDGFKRRLVSQLRERGLDAGLCKSRWEKTSRTLAGVYEYVDVVDGGGARYVVEVDLAAEFKIARPTERYAAMISAFPAVFVGRPESVKEVVRIMCVGAKESIRSRDMHLPPWRKNRYMMGKWFGSYKRTTNVILVKTTSESDGNTASRCSVGFVSGAGISISTFKNCRRNLGWKEGLRIGNLAVALQNMH